jgi:hypothetical protein
MGSWQSLGAHFMMLWLLIHIYIKYVTFSATFLASEKHYVESKKCEVVFP